MLPYLITAIIVIGLPTLYVAVRYTAVARGKAHQDARLELEGKAKRLMERAV
jgi:hypothetical protein